MKWITIIILTVVLFAGWSGDHAQAAGSTEKQAAPNAGQASAPEVKTVTVAELLKAPKVYDGKDVVVRGTFAGFCEDGDYVLKDGFDSLEFYIAKQVPTPPKSKLGSKVEIRGMVKTRRNEVNIIANEVKFP